MKTALLLHTSFLMIAFALATSSAHATNPVAFGAIANDGNDDGPAFRAAYANATATGGDCTLELPAGTFELDREIGKLGALNIQNLPATVCPRGFTIKGVAPSSTLVRMKPRATQAGEDYYLFNIDGSSDVVIRDLALDGMRTSFSGLAEQIHLVRVNNAVRFVADSLHLVESYGDGIKLIAAAGFTVRNSYFKGFRRNGITVHANNAKGFISGNIFEDAADQQIDFESGAGPNLVIIDGNRFGAAAGRIVVALSGGSLFTTDAVISNNVFENGQLQGIYLHRLTVTSNTINSTSDAIRLTGSSRRVTVSSNVLTVSGTSASCLRTESMDGGRLAYDWTIANNDCSFAGNMGFAWNGGGEGRLVYAGNRIRRTAQGSAHGIYIRNTIQGTDLKHVAITGNIITNISNGVYLYATHDDIRDVAISGNIIDTGGSAGTTGVACQWWNHSPYNLGPLVNVRVDANVMIAANRVTNADTNNPYSGPGGCSLHGDAVP